MRNIGEELKAKMADYSSQALQTIIEACQHQFWKIDERDLHYIKPRFDYLGLSLQQYRYPNVYYYIHRRTSPLTLDDILNSCQILYTVYDYMNGVKGCINYLNKQSQFFPWMDEYAIEDGNIIVKPKHNKELLEGVANLQNDELDDIVRMFYKHDVSFATKKNAVEDLANQFLEAKREIIQEALGKTQSDALFNFVNNTNIRHNVNKKDKSEENREPTEHELQIFFDFGLALVRFADQINKNKNLLDK